MGVRDEEGSSANTQPRVYGLGEIRLGEGLYVCLKKEKRVVLRGLKILHKY